jgi:hypothetical protein
VKIKNKFDTALAIYETLKKSINTKIETIFDEVMSQLKTLVENELSSRERLNIELQFEEFIMNKLDDLVKIFYLTRRTLTTKGKKQIMKCLS